MKPTKYLLLPVVMLALAFVLAPFQPQAQAQTVAASEVYIDPGLINELQSRGSARAFVYFAEQADLSPAFGMSWEQRGHFVYDQLNRVAERSQREARRELAKMNANFKPFWVDNVIAIENTSMLMIDMLSSLDNVIAVISEPEGYIPEPERTKQGNETQGPISSIIQIGAPEVWALGYTGEGMVVGIIDSGTRYSHEALVNQYRGHLGGGSFDHNYNWFDIGGSTTPQWPNPHGTHVTGTAIGDDGGSNQIGVAPGADWVSCLGCTSSGCPGANLLSCAEFMAAPTDLAGNNADPSQRPHVVNNSWGSCSTSYDGWYQGAVDAWVAAGIVPVFANGNASNCGYSSPPGLNTVGNPARYGNVLGIGSTGNNNGAYAPHSNWGPTDNLSPGLPNAPDHMGHPEIKPNVAAPGVSIYSSTSSSDSSYGSAGWNGTSMSAPAAAGLVALMWNAAPSLIGDYATTGTIIMQTASPIDYDSGGPNVGPGNVPNHATGWGEINALAAVQAAIDMEGERGDIAGVVTDADTGLPIEGVEVTVANDNPPPDYWTAVTDANGAYQLNLLATETGESYTVEFSRNGYVSDSVAGVEVSEGMVTTVDMTLDPLPGVEISGTVQDANTSDFMVASVTAYDDDGFSYGPAISDAGTGQYSLDVPPGEFYELVVRADGYETVFRDIGEVTGPMTEDFTLGAGIIEMPASASLSLDRGTTGSTSITIENTGTADAEITLSAGEPGTALFEDFEGSFPPDGWTVTDDGDGCVWMTTDDSGMPGWPGSSRAAAIDSDNCGSGTSPDSSLVSPSVDLSAASSATLEFDLAIRSLSNTVLTLQATANGGASWDTIDEWQGEDVAYPADAFVAMSYDLSDYAGESDVQLRWRYQSGWDWWAIVDNVTITSDFVSASWIEIDPSTVIVPEGGSVEVDLHVDATNLDAGTYNLPIVASGSAYPVDPTDFEVTVDPVAEIVFPQSVAMTVEYPTTDSIMIDVDNVGGLEGELEISFGGQLLFEQFETSFPPEDWTVVDDAGQGCVWMRTDEWPIDNYAGGDGHGAAVDSDACGSGISVDTSLVSPVVSLAGAEAAELSLVGAYNHLGSSSFLAFDVSADGGETWTTEVEWTADVDPEGPGTPVSVDLASYLGSTEVQFRARYVAGWDWWALVDDVAIDATISWIQAVPSSVTVPANDSAQVELEVDSSLLAGPGVYSVQMNGEVDSPFAVTPVTVEVTVVPGADLAGINGTVDSLGYCGSEPSAAAGANITIVGQNDTYSVTADEFGFYEIYIPSDENPVDITASVPNHISDTASDVNLLPADSITVDFALDLDEPCIDTAPASFSATIEPNETDVQTLEIGNSNGAGTLDWSLTTAEPTVLTASSGRPAAASGSSNANAGMDMITAFGGDLPLSAGVVPVGVFDCEGAPGLIIHDDGSLENGYSGNPDVVDVVAIVERFTPDSGGVLGTVCVSLLSLGPTELDFELVVFDDDGAGGGPGTEIAAVSATATGIPNSGLPPSPVWYTVDLTSQNIQVESGSVYIGVRYEPIAPGVFIGSDENGPGPSIGFFQANGEAWDQLGVDVFDDYRALFVRPQFQDPSGCATVSDVDWLSFSDDSGSVAAGGSTTIDVIIDSGGMIPGDYEATICVNSNDPFTPIVAVPVSLTVDAPETYAMISGSVTSLGHCDADPAPGAGAQITVTGQDNTFTTSADGNGEYAIAVDSTESPVDVSVTLSGHVGDSESGVILTEGGSVTVDFDLQIELGCTEIFEDQFIAQLMSGDSTSRIMTLSNSGLGSSSFSISSAEIVDMIEVELQRQGRDAIMGLSDDPASRSNDLAAIEGSIRTVSVQPRGSSISVLVLSPDEIQPSNLVSDLNSFPDVSAQLFTGSLSSISVSDLEPYDVVSLVNNNQWAGDANAVGNALADYIDVGGSAVIFNYTFDTFGWELGGRFITEEYGPFGLATNESFSASTMNMLDSGHPIFEGVSSLANGASAPRLDNPVQPDANLIAEWADGFALIAYNDSVVAINALYSSSGGAGDWTGDLDLITYNAVRYIAGPSVQPADWLSFVPAEGSVAAGSQTTVDVVFDATGLADGTYQADVVVEIDEGGDQQFSVIIPATLIVGEDVLFQDRFE